MNSSICSAHIFRSAYCQTCCMTHFLSCCVATWCWPTRQSHSPSALEGLSLRLTDPTAFCTKTVFCTKNALRSIGALWWLCSDLSLATAIMFSCALLQIPTIVFCTWLTVYIEVAITAALTVTMATIKIGVQILLEQLCCWGNRSCFPGVTYFSWAYLYTNE